MTPISRIVMEVDSGLPQKEKVVFPKPLVSFHDCLREGVLGDAFAGCRGQLGV